MCDQPPDCQKALLSKTTGPKAFSLNRSSLVWPGGEAANIRPRPAASKIGRSHSLQITLRGSRRACGPAEKDGGWCRCGLIDAIPPDSTGCPIEVRKLAPGLSLQSQTSQAKVSKVVLRKEVIQPQVPLRLPCYDLVPITGFHLRHCLAAPTTSDAPRFGGLTGGVYKAQGNTFTAAVLIGDY